MNRPKALAELLRLSALPTAMADIFAGYLFRHDGLAPHGTFVALLAASSLIYLGGMVLNDVCDIEQDRRERPGRPIPSGRIALPSARLLAMMLLGAGMVLASLASRTSAVMAAVLVACVIAYDVRFKATPLGPLLMGACRGLNILLGMSTALPFVHGPSIHVALAMTAYVIGITWFGRREAATSTRRQLAAASALMVVAIAATVGLLLWPGPTVAYRYFILFPFLLLPWLSTVTYRAVENPQPALVQRGVRSALMGIVVLDAGVVCAARGPIWAFVVLALLIPNRLLSRRLSPT